MESKEIINPQSIAGEILDNEFELDSEFKSIAGSQMSQIQPQYYQ